VKYENSTLIHCSISARAFRSPGVSGAPGSFASRYRMIALDSYSENPSSSSAGTTPKGCLARCSGVLCAPFMMSTITNSCSAPFSASVQRTLRVHVLIGCPKTFMTFSLVRGSSTSPAADHPPPPCTCQFAPMQRAFLSSRRNRTGTQEIGSSADTTTTSGARGSR
jgi:hypothetical protein